MYVLQILKSLGSVEGLGSLCVCVLSVIGRVVNILGSCTDILGTFLSF